jgi:putative Holliday junction resolvase
MLPVTPEPSTGASALQPESPPVSQRGPRAELPRAGAPAVAVGFDFGLRRIGVAVGDTLTRRARPLSALQRRAADLVAADWRSIETAIATAGARHLVVGCPYNVDGSPGTLTARAQEFAGELAQRVRLPVHLVDERYSSIEAEAALRERRRAGERGRYDRGAIDSAAAAIILERWLEDAAGSAETAGGRAR